MKEIGGYLELDNYTMPMLHENAIALNCGRCCLAYLIEARKIKKIKLPFFLCDCVKEVCESMNVESSYYHIQENLCPEELCLEEDEWLYIVNYYGQLTNEYLQDLVQKYVRVIVDNAQAYFQKPLDGIDTLYICRKFFGVSDGAFLYTDEFIKRELDVDISYDRIQFVLGRYEKDGASFYEQASANNDLFDHEPIKCMSKLTKNLLHGIDYQQVKMQRTKNFVFLHEELGKYNKLELDVPEGAFMYPFYHEKAVEIRKKLQQEKIYIPVLWPNVLDDVAEGDLEYLYTQNILPLPCDQRYSVEDMKVIIDAIRPMI